MVFKPTWPRLDDDQAPPAGALSAAAQVPHLTAQRTKTQVTITPVPGQCKTVKVTAAEFAARKAFEDFLAELSD